MPSYERNNIWLTRLVSEGHEEGLGEWTVRGSALAGGIPLVLMGTFLWLTRDAVSTEIAVAQLLAAMLGVVGPAFVWYYDERLYPLFVEEMSDVVTDRSELETIADRYHALFAERYWLAVVPWTPALVAAYVLNFEFFLAYGVTGFFDPAALVYLLLVLWMGLLTGIGLHMAVVSVLFIHEVGKLELVIDPLHPDGFGGLSSIGRFTIWTTLLISIGSLAFPLAFAIAAQGGYSAIVYTVVAVYIGVLLLSFFYPTVYINRKANAVRGRVLAEKRERIRALSDRILETDGSTEDVSRLSTQLDVMKSEFEAYRNVTLYPLSIGLLTRLASSILLPLFFFGLELFVQ